MLGKLLKYEVKAAGKVMPALYLGIGLSYLLGKLTEALHIHQMKIGLAIACIGIGHRIDGAGADPDRHAVCEGAFRGRRVSDADSAR